MHAIINIADKQFKVEPKQYIYTPKLKYPKGHSLEVHKVMVFCLDENQIQIGTPFLKEIIVKATIENHSKDDKVTIFKKKRRKGYKKKQGHRQRYTKLRIESIQQMQKT